MHVFLSLSSSCFSSSSFTVTQRFVYRMKSMASITPSGFCLFHEINLRILNVLENRLKKKERKKECCWVITADRKKKKEKEIVNDDRHVEDQVRMKQPVLDVRIRSFFYPSNPLQLERCIIYRNQHREFRNLLKTKETMNSGRSIELPNSFSKATIIST